MERRYDYLAKLGVQVHDRHDWPSIVIGQDPAWFDYVRATTKFHTTQDCVWLDGVEAKVKLIRSGRAPWVTVIAAHEFGDTHVWVSNGHHTLAAYLLVKKRPYVRYFARASGTAGYPVTAPKFDPRART